MSYPSGDTDDSRRIRMHNAFKEGYSEYPELAELAGAGVDPREILGIVKILKDQEFSTQALQEKGREADQDSTLKALLGAGDIASKANLMGMQLDAGKYQKPVEAQMYKASAMKSMAEASLAQKREQELGRNARLDKTLDWKEQNPPASRALPQANLDAMQRGLQGIWKEMYGSRKYNPAIGALVANALAARTAQTGKPPTPEEIREMLNRAAGPPPPEVLGIADRLRAWRQ